MIAAETLREAARLMRERAEAATLGPWYSSLDEVHTDWHPGSTEYARYGGDQEIASANTQNADADHIAAMHPGVALAVADWLDEEALRAWHWAQVGKPAPGQSKSALAVARAYLGEAP